MPRSRRIPARSLIAALALVPALLAGCGAGPPTPETPAEPSAADTIRNCDVDVPVERPERIVAMFHNGVEAVLALGAGDRLVGAAYLDNPLLPELAGDFHPDTDQPIYWPEEYPSREEVLRIAPDLVVSGFTGAFTREGLGTRAELADAGMNTFLFSSFCPTADGGTQEALAANDASLDAVQRDLTELGRLLGAEDRAAELVGEMRSTLDDVAGRLDGVTERPRIAMLNAPASRTELRVFGTGDVATTIIEAAGGTQAFPEIAGRQRTVSSEGIIAAAPDVIVIPACCGIDAGPESAEPLAEKLRNDPALATVPAIREGKVFTTTFAEVSPGIRNADAVRALAGRLHPDRFTDG
ncbi:MULTISPECIES: ABC transporter substrate-binding protein [Pseudonocardia]|uniref:Corrinoid ABC transporter substrate-binding protein n=2 Tax=Pseudonocardia TaxID=1847 RepID=A0A1Y2MK40_PSEAH|nr:MULTISPECIES: ABC transporter substrate-binding protein [Pseudonocardia]OSY35441.1 corrinoid ABC transporter substrate-binding protein [Pseudonocardia autotrophica]TDN72192.1 iron complex transport system substrate-binding protein [Pseudonocardia autotrophica]BBG02899.1 lipoprotein [Pseudonocardia autotrophica]GEC27637.1 lipoprotein [Pseudonocardia saturnea]